MGEITGAASVLGSAEVVWAKRVEEAELDASRRSAAVQNPRKAALVLNLIAFFIANTYSAI